ncbi:hypothetical protein LXL04_024069 [Taraxacum kok-saghyz]
MLNRIPLSNNLSSKWIQVTSLQCKMCLLENENVDHVFFRCDYALSLWLWLCNWRGLMGIVPIDHVSFSASVINCNGDVETKKMLFSLGYTVLWLIWKERNERFFGTRIKKAMQLADDIQLFTFNWIKNSVWTGRSGVLSLGYDCVSVPLLWCGFGVGLLWCFFWAEFWGLVAAHGVCLVYVSLRGVSLYGYGLPLVLFVFVSKGCVMDVFGVLSFRFSCAIVVVSTLCSCVMLVAFGLSQILWVCCLLQVLLMLSFFTLGRVGGGVFLRILGSSCPSSAAWCVFWGVFPFWVVCYLGWYCSGCSFGFYSWFLSLLDGGGGFWCLAVDACLLFVCEFRLVLGFFLVLGFALMRWQWEEGDDFKRASEKIGCCYNRSIVDGYIITYIQNICDYGPTVDPLLQTVERSFISSSVDRHFISKEFQQSPPKCPSVEICDQAISTNFTIYN